LKRLKPPNPRMGDRA